MVVVLRHAELQNTQSILYCVAPKNYLEDAPHFMLSMMTIVPKEPETNLEWHNNVYNRNKFSSLDYNDHRNKLIRVFH